MMLFIIYQIIVFILFLLSGFFSGSETAIISSNKYIIEEMAAEKKLGAKAALSILDRIDQSLSMILIGNNIANIVATAFITYIATVYYGAGEYELLVITIVQTIIFLLFCEIIPKLFSRANANRLLCVFAFPLQLLIVALTPLINVTLIFTRFAQKFFLFGDHVDSRIQARNEIETLFQMGEKAGLIEQNHRIYVDEILSLHKIKVNQVMTPTVDVQSIEIKQSMRQLIKLIEKTRYSRVPVYEDRVDNVVGYIYYKDLYKDSNIEKKIEDVMRRPIYVPGTKKIYELYKEMQGSNNHMVFVVNEYGGVEGLATREDIAEEIVGEIQTTDHLTDELVIQKEKHLYSVKGSLDIEYFCRLFSVSIKKDGYETLAGFLNYMFGKIPRKGDELSYKHLNFQIESADNTYIDRVLVRRRSR